jgi:hypothetical protein
MWMPSSWAIAAAIGVILLVPIGPAAQSGDAPGFKTIEGRRNPELIPDEVVWEITFDTWVSLCTREETPGECIGAISKHNVYIPEKDARALVAVGEATLRDVRALREPLKDPHTHWTPAQRVERRASIGRRVLAGRDELRAKIPRRSFRAIERWIAAFKPSLTVQVPE